MPRLLALALALALAPAACDRPRATPPDDGPPLACEAAWTRLPPADRTYDPGRDALVTDAGNQGYASYAARVHRDRCIKPWKVMLFMAADNEDLPLHAYWNLRDLETTPGAASTAFVDVLVHLDLPGPGGLRRLHLFADEGGAPPTAEAMQAATPLTLRSPIVELRPDESAPPADALRDFLAWGERAYPSERTMVVLWGHGQGWRPRLPQEPDGVRYQEGGFVGGIAFDHHERTVIDIPSLADALAVLAAPVDVLAADACLMQTAEVDLALADVARYLVGYEPIAPYPGLPYRLLLPALDDPPIAPSRCPASDPACHLAERIPALYQGAVASGHYSARAPADQVDRTYAISSIAAAPLRARLLPALDALGDALDAWLRDDPFRAIDVQGLLAPSGLPAFLGGTRDLGEVASGLRRLLARELERARGAPPSAVQSSLTAALDGLDAALADVVLARSAGTLYAEPAHAAVGGLAGLAVWLPRTPDELRARASTFETAPLFAPGPATTPWERWITTAFTPPG